MHIARSFQLNKSTTKLENPFGNDIVLFRTTVLCDVITLYYVIFVLGEIAHWNQLEILYKIGTKTNTLVSFDLLVLTQSA